MSKELRFMAGGDTSWQGNNPLQSVIMRALQEAGGWSVKAMRKPGFKMLEAVESEFRAAAPLTDKAQVVIDRAVVEVGQQRLTFVADLISAGLTYSLNDPLSVSQLEWYSSDKVGAAKRTMSPSARGERKMPTLTPNRLPVYLTTDDFSIDIRTLKQSQRAGMPLDTTLVKQCTRSVNEAIEDAAINGATTLDGQDLKVAGYGAPGILNAPNAEVQTLTLAAWSTVPVGQTVFNETMAMIAKLQGNNKFGPYRMYIPTTVGNMMAGDYNTTSGNPVTIQNRLLQIPGLEAIRIADKMPANKVALVQMTSDVVDVVMGQAPTVIPWTSLDGFMIYNLVMAIVIPRVRSDAAGDSGIVIGTLT